MKSKDRLKTIVLALILTASALVIAALFKPSEEVLVKAEVPTLRSPAAVEPEASIDLQVNDGSAIADQMAGDTVLPGSGAFLLSAEQIEKLKEQLFSEQMEAQLFDYAHTLPTEPKDKELVREEKLSPDIELDDGNVKRYADGSSYTTMLVVGSDQRTERYQVVPGEFYIRRLHGDRLYSAEWSEGGENYSVDFDQDRIRRMSYRSEVLKIEFVRDYEHGSKKTVRFYRSLIDGSRVFF